MSDQRLPRKEIRSMEAEEGGIDYIGAEHWVVMDVFMTLNVVMISWTYIMANVIT